jgi:hypothetical protein
MFRRSNGAPGGTVVHWKSLDDGGPMVLLLEGDLHADWQTMPLFSRRYGAYYFFIWHNNRPAPPPAVNPQLGTRDAAMIARLEESLPNMNQLVAESAAVVRNMPPPAPVAPGAKKFWRIHADWSVDTDNDGSFDWLEFLMAADDSHPQHGLADTFAADTNGDGIADGSQLDYDSDGSFDVDDLMVKDRLIDWDKLPVPLYATFPVPVHASGPPLHINSQGMVLFPGAIRIDGQTFPLTMGGTHAVAIRAIGMNDWGQILGVGYRLPTPSSGGGSLYAVAPEEILVWWNSSFDNGPTPVTDGEHDAQDVCLQYWQAAQGITPPDALALRFPWDRILDNEGRFVAFRDADNPEDPPVRKVWRHTASGFAEDEETGAESLFTYTAEQLELASYAYGPSGQGTEVWSSGMPHSTIEGRVSRLTCLPSGRLAAIRAGSKRPLLEDGSGGWQLSALFSDALADAGRLGSQPLRSGGKMVYMDLLRESPRVWPKVAPVAAAAAVEHLDSTDNGWLLSTEDESHTASMPVILEDGAFGSGVDHFSVTSSAPGPECEDRAWIMAPAGPGGLNGFTLRSAAGPNAKVTVAAENVPLVTFADLVPGASPSDGTLVLESASVAAFVDASGTDPMLTGSAIYPTFTLGGDDASTTPVGIKIMKARTIRVKVWVVPKAIGTASSKDPVYLPTKQELDDYLTNIFKPQVNAAFNCDIEEIDPVAFESEAGDDFGGPSNAIWENGYQTLDQFGNGQGEMDDVSESYDASRSINVYLVGGVGGGQKVEWDPATQEVQARENSNGQPEVWIGTSDVAGRRCWVIGGSNDGTTPGITPESIRDTLGHEIGHVIVGAGHPDDGGGVAPLPDTPHVQRLMCSGPRRKTDGASKLLVKAEWDEAEEWLRLFVDTPQP